MALKRFGVWPSVSIMVAALPATLAISNSYAEDQGMRVLAQASSGPLTCEIRKTDEGSAPQLVGVISSSRAMTGKFHFSLTKAGPSGSSNINQANKFEVGADSETRVALVQINLDPAGHVAVELFAASDDGVECRARTDL